MPRDSVRLQVCRVVPPLMQQFDLEEVTSKHRLRRTVAERFLKHKTLDNPDVRSSSCLHCAEKCLVMMETYTCTLFPCLWSRPAQIQCGALRILKSSENISKVATCYAGVTWHTSGSGSTLCRTSPGAGLTKRMADTIIECSVACAGRGHLDSQRAARASGKFSRLVLSHACSATIRFPVQACDAEPVV